MEALTEKQKQTVDILLKNSSKSGTLNFTMRSGKTPITLDYLSKVNAKSVLWICDSVTERDVTMKAECLKFGKQALYKKITFIHHKSLHKVVDKVYDRIVFNECTNITEGIVDMLTRHILRGTPILGLTGTYPNTSTKKDLFKRIGLNNIIAKYDIDDAAKDGTIQDYTIEVISIPMNKKDNVKVIYIDKISKQEKSFTTSEYKSYYSYLSKIDNAKSAKEATFHTFNLKRIVSKFNSKVDYCRDLLLQYINQRTIVFAMDTEHSNMISSLSYNSNTDDIDFRMFNAFKIPHIVLVNKGSIGTNYSKIDNIIMLAPDSTNYSTLQKLARGMINDSKKSLNIKILITKDSIQKKWVEKALMNTDNSKISWKEVI